MPMAGPCRMTRTLDRGSCSQLCRPDLAKRRASFKGRFPSERPISLLKPPANQIERLLAGPGANVFPVAAKAPFHHIGLLAIGHGDVNQAHRLLLRAAARTGDTRDPEAKGCRRLAPDSFRQRPGNLPADRAMFLKQRRSNTRRKAF